MSKLTSEFESSVGGSKDKFERVFHNHPYYIYKRTFENGGNHCFEYFRAKHIPAGHKMPNGSVTEEESWNYPGSSQFGKTAWSCNTLETARKDLAEKIAVWEKKAEKKVAAK